MNNNHIKAKNVVNGDKENLLQLRRICKSARKRIKKKIEKQKSEYEIAGKWLWYRQIGDSLLADPSAIPKWVAEWSVYDVHSGIKETVKLNPKFDAVRNAEIYYRKSKKGKRGVEVCKEQLHISKEELLKIEALIDKCNDCLLLDENTDEFKETLNAIKSTMEENSAITGLPKDKNAKKDVPKIPYRHFTIDGWDIYIGKNNAQNDELSIKFAKPWDIWFHVAAHSGSHVILRRNKNTDWPPKYIIEKVAALSVWFSKVKHTSYAEVDVTEARFVRKRRKAPPGEVIAEQCKTVRVSPKSPQELFK